jgi:hypothetical protein
MIGTTTFKATARFDEGEVKISVTGSCPYGKRTATVTVEVDDEKLLSQIGSLLDKAVRSVREDLNQQATAAAAKCLVVATDMKEKV